MLLSVKERFVLLSILPPQGNITDIRVLRELRDALSFSEAEHKDFGFKFVGEGAQQTVQWDEKKQQPKDVNVGPRAIVIIQDTLKKMDGENQLGFDHVDIYDKFMKNGKKKG